MANVEIQGLDKLKAAFIGVDRDLTPSIYREIAKKPANVGVKVARNLQPIGDSGATAKTIGILRIRNSRQTYVEVGYKGRSLGHIYVSGPIVRRRNRGSIKGFPWLFTKSGQSISASAKKEMKVDVTRAFVRSFKRRLR